MTNKREMNNKTPKKILCPTRGVSNVGDVMTSSQQNSHGGSTNGG